MHRQGFGEAECIDLLKWIPRKFIVHFSEVYTISYKLLNLDHFLEFTRMIK
jgi:hypothetical protein